MTKKYGTKELLSTQHFEEMTSDMIKLYKILPRLSDTNTKEDYRTFKELAIKTASYLNGLNELFYILHASDDRLNLLYSQIIDNSFVGKRAAFKPNVIDTSKNVAVDDNKSANTTNVDSLTYEDGVVSITWEVY